MQGFSETCKVSFLVPPVMCNWTRLWPMASMTGTMLAKMAKQPHVVAASPSLYEEVMVNRAARASGMELKGVIPEYENRVSELLKSVTIGSAAALAPKPSPTPCPARDRDEECRQSDEMPPIVLGKDLAESIGATVGSTVNITSPQGELTPFGLAPKFERFKVVGIFRSGFYNDDSTWGFTRLAGVTTGQPG